MRIMASNDQISRLITSINAYYKKNSPGKTISQANWEDTIKICPSSAFDKAAADICSQYGFNNVPPQAKELALKGPEAVAEFFANPMNNLIGGPGSLDAKSN
jgi:hypothetical protein